MITITGFNYFGVNNNMRNKKKLILTENCFAVRRMLVDNTYPEAVLNNGHFDHHRYPLRGRLRIEAPERYHC